MTKQDLRRTLKQKRLQLAGAEIAEKSVKIAARLGAAAFYQNARTVMAYCSAFGEVDTREVLARLWADGKTVYVPLCDIQKQEAWPVQITDMADLQPGAYGILEPRTGQKAQLKALDLILVPGIAFDRRGGRIGFGAGYYDKLLQNMQAYKAALAYDFQIVEDAFSQPHDVAMNCIITESELIVCE